jgi:hypothetical protein
MIPAEYLNPYLIAHLEVLLAERVCVGDSDVSKVLSKNRFPLLSQILAK